MSRGCPSTPACEGGAAEALTEELLRLSSCWQTWHEPKALLYHGECGTGLTPAVSPEVSELVGSF